MFRRYQFLNNTFKTTQATLFSKQCRNMSYVRLIENMVNWKLLHFKVFRNSGKKCVLICSKQTIKHLKRVGYFSHYVLNITIAKTTYDRFYQKLLDNKKKIAIFLGICAILNLFEAYKSELYS